MEKDYKKMWENLKLRYENGIKVYEALAQSCPSKKELCEVGIFSCKEALLDMREVEIWTDIERNEEE